MNICDKYKTELSAFLNVKKDAISLYWKGRVALYTALKSMGISKGDEVIIPAFTCVVVPNAIIYLGATPIYVDIEEQNLCTTKNLIEKKITHKTKCIVIQNMLGLSNEVDEIVLLAKKHGLYTIEDCTHGFGGKYNGLYNGLKSDCSFYSSQWNKPFSTGVGGILLVNNQNLKSQIELNNKNLSKPSNKSKLTLHLLILLRKYILKDWSYWFLLKLYRKLSMLGLVVGSSQKEEITGITIPNNYLISSSYVQAKFGLKELKQMHNKLSIRKENGLIYNEWMKKNNKYFIDEKYLDNHSFLKYPILVKDRDVFLTLAVQAKIQMGDWFISPLHPVKDNLSQWHLEKKNYPCAVKISQHILNLPSDVKNVNAILKFLNKNKAQIL